MPKVGRRRTGENPEKERGAGGGGAQGEKMPKAGRRRTRGNPDLETEREAKKRSLAEEASPSAMFAAFERGDAPQSEAKSERVYDVVESVMEESSGSPIPLLHEPYIPDELASHPGIHHAFELAEAKYNAEKGRVPLNKCCGLWFQQDEEKKTAIVLTSAHLVRKQDPSVMNQWTGKYHCDARPIEGRTSPSTNRRTFTNGSNTLMQRFTPFQKGLLKIMAVASLPFFEDTTIFLSESALSATLCKVIVHLLDGTTARGSLLYLQEHYEIALYEVTMHKPVELPTFNDTVHSGQDVFRLGRDDESLDLKITHGRVEYKIPFRHERCHYLYFSSDESRHRLCLSILA
ncbi:hypothetical protein TRIUR3_25780 [Triticum urartu]|uniref:Uncharacterized protein n=1 Tax=Triticum urartu TaxID=4572 RepID=M8AKJ1_TRIUA|nr:hypothetical protein TRIUR3_25780 [Triticum urartu]